MGPWEFWKDPAILGLAGILSLAYGLTGFRFNPEMGIIFLCVSGGLIGACIKTLRPAGGRSAPEAPTREEMFLDVELKLKKLNAHVQHLVELRENETMSTRTPRGEKRLEMLNAVIENRQKKASLLQTELWARDIQLWLNKLEGFLAEKLVRLNRENGGMLLGEFRDLINSGERLQKKMTVAAKNSELGAKACRLLQECLARAPEFEERVRDARVLAAVDEIQDAPIEFSEGRTWLHWIQNALPNLDSLPDVMKVDEEYVRMNAELRLLRDAPKTVSLDRKMGLDEHEPGVHIVPLPSSRE